MQTKYKLYRVPRSKWKCMICGKIKKRRNFCQVGGRPLQFCKSCEQKLGGPNSCRRELRRQSLRENIRLSRYWKDKLIIELEAEE